MAYDEYLADRIRQRLTSLGHHFNEKKMMGGLCFMMDDKMLCGIVRNELMARIGPTNYESSLSRPGVKEMTFTGRSMKGYVFVDGDGYDLDEDLEHWIDLCVAFNPLAKSSKKKKK